jgi:uncharacterized protein
MVALDNAPDLTKAFGARGNDFLQRAVGALVEKLPVVEIWLFGSAARGTARSDSDLDLLVVLEDGHGLKQPTADCFSVLFGMRDVVAPDVLTLSRSEWEYEKANPFGVFGDVAKEGIRVYAA